MIDNKNINMNFFSSSPYSDIVIRTKVTMVRNLISENFSWRNSQNANNIIQKKIEEALIDLEKNSFLKKYTIMDSYPTKFNQFRDCELLDKNYNFNGKNIFYINENRNCSIMINKDDHINISSVTTGFDKYSALENIKVVNSELEKRLDYAFDYNYGYLTANLNMAGTGLEYEVLIYIPAIEKNNKIAELSDKLVKEGVFLSKYEFQVDGVKNNNAFFIIKTNNVIGKSEEEVISDFDKIISLIINTERLEKKNVGSQYISQVEEDFNNAIKMIKENSKFTYFQALELLSQIRLATSYNFCNYSFHILNAIFYLINDELIKLVYNKVNAEKLYCDFYRADLFKKTFLEKNMEELCLKG